MKRKDENDIAAMKKLLEERLDETIARHHSFYSQLDMPMRDIELKKNDAYKQFLESRIARLEEYERNPEYFEHAPTYHELHHMLKVMETGSAADKMSVLKTVGTEYVRHKAFTKKAREDLLEKTYRLEMMTAFRSRLIKFHIGGVLVFFGAGMAVYFGRELANEISPEGLACIIAWVAFACYNYLGNKLYRCPACNYGFDFTISYVTRNGRRRLNTSDIQKCPRCGIEFY